MAAHRKPKYFPFGGQAARTAATLALASAATATVFQGTGHAAPRPAPAQVRAQVDRLYEEAEVATEKYNGAKEQVGRARAALDRLRDEAARRTERLNRSRDALGAIATAQYRAGALDPTLQLAFTSDPDDYLERASLAEKVGNRQAATITAVRRELGAVHRLRAQAGDQLRDLQAREADLRHQKSAVRGKLNAARELLAQLSAEDRARYEAAVATGGHDAGAGSGTGGADGVAGAAGRAGQDLGLDGPVTAGTGRAAEAISFARAQIGKPYVWGATGPSSYDCSGLTQAAWRAAGVTLPRTTYTQINAGRRVSRSELAPGDLVFFYSGVSHVGLYIGDGRMIHAPRPGAPIRVAPIDQMPFAGATRIG
ncbi:NLP/P60 protein [Streptomyces laurentii]|uniref:NLP/P60 protein n=1 Tax=Streptomyces laurentii TaxID=39478 RepID=A0A160P475_STRLU|nr:NLP/P60 protein [Streptomyces laurentii]